jgi:hypothetical protein
MEVGSLGIFSVISYQLSVRKGMGKWGNGEMREKKAAS